MPTLVHIADAKLSARIAKGGIAPGKDSKVVYFMPVMHDHFVSHQWIRELRRRGARTLVGVYFRLESEESVWAGRYNEEHQRKPLGLAISELMRLDDPLGYELFIDREITAREIARVRAVPPTVGWRYMPHAHGRKLCGCPACLPRGSIKSRALRERLEPAPEAPSYESIKQRLRVATDLGEIMDCLWPLRQKRRRADPAFLSRLLEMDDPDVLAEVATTLSYFRHPGAVTMLEKLTSSPYEEVRETALLGLKQLDRQA